MHQTDPRTPRSANDARKPAPKRAGSALSALLRVLAFALVLFLCAAVPARALEDPAVNATAALLVDPDTGTVLYESNADETRYPASMTKIMTALLTLENADLDDEVTVEASDLTEVTWDSTVAGLMAGETYTVRDLLYGLLLPSGNDASYVLARYVGGSVEKFVQMMNDRAVELGCTNTHFANPCGLHDDNHWSCARDIYRMAYAAMQNATFAEIVATTSYTMPATDLQPAHELENTNLLIDPDASCYYEPCFGVKTGNTTEAGRCLAAAAEKDGVTLYCVVMGCPSAQAWGEVNGNFTAALTLFDWGYQNWSRHAVLASGTTVESVPVIGAAAETRLSVAIDGTVEGLLPNDLAVDALEVSYELPENIAVPVGEGASLGTATYRYHGVELATVGLVAGNTVMPSPVACVVQYPQLLQANPVFAVGIAVAALVLVAVIVLIIRSALRSGRANRPGGGTGAYGSSAYGRGAVRQMPVVRRSGSQPADTRQQAPGTEAPAQQVGQHNPHAHARGGAVSGGQAHDPQHVAAHHAGSAAHASQHTAAPRQAQDTASVLYPQQTGAPTVHSAEPFEPRSERIKRRVPSLGGEGRSQEPSGRTGRRLSADPDDTAGLWS